MQQQQMFTGSLSDIQVPCLAPKGSSGDSLSPLRSKSNINTQQYSWMDQYLNIEVFRSSYQENEHQRVQNPQPSLPTLNQRQNVSEQNENPSQAPQRKNRSMFHNFQKHIITLLKRIINIRRIELLNCFSGLRAYQLWKLFKISKDYTKKTLYMIFGVAQEQNHKNLVRMGQQLPELQKMLEKSSIEDIQAAQALLRQKIGSQIAQVSKEFVKQNCKMQKFQDFYSYFLNFTDQLQHCGLSKRLRKDKKIRLVQSSMGQGLQRQ